MKKTILLIALLIGFACAKAQVDVNTGLLIDLNATQTTALASSQLLEVKMQVLAAIEVAKNSTGFINDFESLKLITQLLTDLVCLTDQVSLYSKASINYSNCFMSLKFNMALLNLSFTTDVLKSAIVAVDLITMSSAQRTASLKSTIETIQAALYNLNELKTSMDIEITQRVISEYRIKEQKQISKTVSYSRYGNN